MTRNETAKALRGIEHCTTDAGCKRCPYAKDGEGTNSCQLLSTRDAARAIRAMSDEIELLKAQVDNLHLYLEETLRAQDELGEWLEELHPGTPGFEGYERSNGVELWQ